MKKLLSIMLSIIMVIPALSMVFAAGNEIITVSEVDFENTMAISDDLSNLGNLNLPSKYDSRNYGYVTPVKTQAAGTCWAYSFLGAVEASDIKRGVAPANVDYSEGHLIWFTGNPVASEYNALDGKNYGTEIFSMGLSHLKAMPTAVLCGFNYEKDYPLSYENFENYSLNSSERNANTTNRLLSKMIVFDNIDDVKQAIVDSAAVSASFYFSTNYLTKMTGPNNTLIETYYCPEKLSKNHGVVIVGWDDNFSRENFINEPPIDGAWLVKDSAGISERWDGYKWISYADATLGYATTYSTMENIYSDVYSYTTGFTELYSYSANQGANVYTARNDIAVRAAGFMFYGNDGTYTVSVYTNLTDGTRPDSGTLSETKTVSVHSSKTLPGYMTVSFDNKNLVKAGQKYSVVVAAKQADGSKPVFLTEYKENFHVEEYQSFIKILDTSRWRDTTLSSYNLGNLCINAYAVDPNDTTQPDIPDNPVNPDNPSNPDNPDTPDVPDTPDNPDNPPVNPPAHTHTSKTVRVDATCAEEGYEKVYCEECGTVFSNTVIPKLDHEYGPEIQTGFNLFAKDCFRCGHREEYSKNLNFFEKIWYFFKFLFKW